MAKAPFGSRPRPRVALVGQFPEDAQELCATLFPTLWASGHLGDLYGSVDPRELDLIILGPNVSVAGPDHFRGDYHLISFSGVADVPGPIFASTVTFRETVNLTEEYEFGDLPLALARQRHQDFQHTHGVRGWSQLSLWVPEWAGVTAKGHEEVELAKERFQRSAFVFDSATKTPLAVLFQREPNDLFVACLPNEIFSRAPWIELLALHISQFDRERFPGFRDWSSDAAWMTEEETQVANQIAELLELRAETLRRIDADLGKLETDARKLRKTVDSGPRRLLTAQDSALVAAVAEALTDLGFLVTDVDEELAAGAPLREDLRLRHGDLSDWEAVVEVRGYAKSAGKAADLIRIGRFVDFYRQENGKLPSMRIYIVNSQFDLPPSVRGEPLAAEDVAAFAESDGLVMSTSDLFRAWRIRKQYPQGLLAHSIADGRGRWKLPPIPS